jgi:hypothetical protein
LQFHAFLVPVTLHKFAAWFGSDKNVNKNLSAVESCAATDVGTRQTFPILANVINDATT